MANNFSNVTIVGGGTTTTGSYYTGAVITAAPFPTSKIRITDTDIELGEWSLQNTLANLNSKLAIMVPNPALEKEFVEIIQKTRRYVVILTRRIYVCSLFEGELKQDAKEAKSVNSAFRLKKSC